MFYRCAYGLSNRSSFGFKSCISSFVFVVACTPALNIALCEILLMMADQSDDAQQYLEECLNDPEACAWVLREHIYKIMELREFKILWFFLERMRTDVQIYDSKNQRVAVCHRGRYRFRECNACKRWFSKEYMSKRWCSGCNNRVYCSRTCQKADWRAHKPNCFMMRVSAITDEEFMARVTGTYIHDEISTASSSSQSPSQNSNNITDAV